MFNNLSGGCCSGELVTVVGIDVEYKLMFCTACDVDTLICVGEMRAKLALTWPASKVKL